MELPWPSPSRHDVDSFWSLTSKFECCAFFAGLLCPNNTQCLPHYHTASFCCNAQVLLETQSPQSKAQSASHGCVRVGIHMAHKTLPTASPSSGCWKHLGSSRSTKSKACDAIRMNGDCTSLSVTAYHLFHDRRFAVTVPLPPYTLSCILAVSFNHPVCVFSHQILFETLCFCM